MLWRPCVCVRRHRRAHHAVLLPVLAHIPQQHARDAQQCHPERGAHARPDRHHLGLVVVGRDFVARWRHRHRDRLGRDRRGTRWRGDGAGTEHGGKLGEVCDVVGRVLAAAIVAAAAIWVRRVGVEAAALREILKTVRVCG